MGLLTHAGAEITPRAEEADVIVVNTCSFIDTAKQESIDAILEMARHKTEGRARKLVVAGCMVERYREQIRKEIPEVDAVVGTGELEQILAATGLQGQPQDLSASSPFAILNFTPPQAPALPSPRAGSASGRPSSAVAGRPSRPEATVREQAGRFSREQWDGAVAGLPDYLYDDTTPRLLATPRHLAYIKIAEGCDHPCTFCVIPQLRGKFRSRRFESVIAEAERLARGGVREIVLVGQDTTCYGEDLGLKDGLALLLERLAGIQELRWIRFLYAYPNKITRRLLETMAANNKICPYLDVPLQHSSAAVLRRMKRGGSGDIYLRLIETARRTVPQLTLRTSFIVGFPGETLEDFKQLCDFVREAKFDWMGVFAYSDEEGAPAYEMRNKVAPREINRRRKQLMEIQRRISRRQKHALVRSHFDAVLEGPSAETQLLWKARTIMHAPEIDGDLFINDFGPHMPRAGEFYRCEISEAHDYDLIARLV